MLSAQASRPMKDESAAGRSYDETSEIDRDVESAEIEPSSMSNG